jgi:DNA-binding GntR family transcriptional regulator
VIEHNGRRATTGDGLRPKGHPGGHGLPRSLPQHVADTLARDIVEGRLRAGERVTEDDLGARLGVSRTSVREAMRMLEGQGLIVRRRDRGAVVAKRTGVDEARAIYELRVTLEGHLAAAAAERITAGELRSAWRLHEDFLARLAGAVRGTAQDLVAIDSELHWTIYRGSGSDLISIVASYWGRLQRELYDPVYRHEPEAFAAQHATILEALQAHDAPAARAATAAHVRSGWEAVARAYAVDDVARSDRAG